MKRGSHHTEETKKRMRIPREIRICACGCGETFECKVTSKQRFIHGHNFKNQHHTKETKERLRKIHEGKKKSKEHCKNISKGRKGIPSHVKGEFHHTEESKKKSSETHISFWQDPVKRKERSESQKQLWQDPEYRDTQTISHRKVMLKLWQDPKYKEKQLKAIFKGLRLLPNKPEKFLIKLFQELFPNLWKYIGDGKDEDSFVAGKCPDFVHVNQKKIIEFNGDYWHGEKATGRTKEEEEQQRIDLFAKHGYQTLIIWYAELEDIGILKKKLIDFNET